MPTALDAGTYDLLRDRLTAQAAELARRTEALNVRRTEAFGSGGMELGATERIRTGHPCVPRDIISVGGRLLFGYNVPPGPQPQTAVGDVFALHDHELNPLDEGAVPGLLDDPAFAREFAALYRYYRDARLLQLRLVDGTLLAVFQTGEKTGDIRVLRWAVASDGTVTFLDARGDRDHVFPPSHDFVWTETTRADHVLGRHPHISVDGAVFVATVGGTLTVKGENDTESAEGIHSEPVDEPLQSLADADVEYAQVGALILLRVRPYKETAHRYLVFNTLTRTVVRFDGIGQACHRLPEDQGIVFPGGYCLATGAHRTFDLNAADLEFERMVRSPNGEDVLFAYHARAAGRSLLLPYNMIRKEIATPLSCHGWALFDDGTLMVLRAEADEPARVHPLQIWRSPYLADTHAAAVHGGVDGPLARVGNADLVRGISDCLSLARSVTEVTPTSEVYEALVASCVRTGDLYHWLGEAELGALGEPLGALRATAESIVGEFETVLALTRQAARSLDEAAAQIASLVRKVRGEAPRSAAQWVDALAELRQAKGRLITLGELRYVDTDRIEALAEALDGDLASAAQRAVGFLERPDAFASYRSEIEDLVGAADEVETVASAQPLAEDLDERTARLRALTETVAGLDIGDATVRTGILERIAEVLGGVNRARATLAARRRALLDREGRAGFAAEFALLGQAVTGALAAADSPEACAEQLARLLLQLENLESRFAEFDGFLLELATKREEVYEAFSARRQALQDARARHAERLADSAARILDTVARRATTLAAAGAGHAWFAARPLVAQGRRTAEELRGLGDRVRAEELEGRLKSARQEAARALRDREDLYDDDGTAIRLGRHRFAVNTQPLDLTMVPHGGTLAFALTGTDYRAPVTDPGFAATRPYWDRLLPSESPEVYRAEHLAARLLEEGRVCAADDLDAFVRAAAEAAYDEGYERGVHDHDAALILRALLRLCPAAGLLRYPPAERAVAQEFWAHGTAPQRRTAWTLQAKSLARARAAFGLAPTIDALTAELAAAMADMTPVLPHAADLTTAAEYLFEELTRGPDGFVTGPAARTLLDKFLRSVDAPAYEADLRAIVDVAARRRLIEGWLGSYAASCGEQVEAGDLAEAVAVTLCPDLVRHDSDADVTATVTGLLGSHPRVKKRRLTLRLDEFLARTREFRQVDVPRFRAFQRSRAALVDAERVRLRLADLRPKVMSAFVRNRLIDEVYLPLIGDNLAKQLGTADAARRTDTNGLLLLISPPGYGKTTLMEYVADRLGLVLVKVNGPALGHGVTSLDPARAPDATARQEVEKINFALEAGSNTLLYLDDIQHTSPELLQKFIALCDAQRRIEGVWNGETRTYDLRGKRFAVCMAGNPYTESGGRFQLPDMLANRADVWNLGEVLTGKEEVFAASFIENALTSNPALAPLAGRSPDDLDRLMRRASGDPTARTDRLAHAYAPAELEQILAVLRHLLTARRTVLAVNEAYIASAAQSASSRTEPPFQLQGSYRNMNKIAERIVPAMNDAELAAVLDDHYSAEAQTLTTGAESNLLKLAALRGTLTPDQAARFAEIKAAFVRERALGGPQDDPVSRAVAALGLLADRVAAVESAIVRVADPRHVLSNPHGRHRVP
ncbi:DNA repair ATPase [Streptomyces sp. N35]|uniref:DNA repair ATPase n=1 Tax=Streptomyces sp. N35 TaxID=2795730 RepID=UPI0018F79DFA|nr:DNA repair ATPase [Streptomyces sp. N35]